MPKVALFNMQGDQVGEIELADNVFGVEVNTSVLHDVVVQQLASRRRGTAATKSRGMVRGGGRKPWRQKGTGRARAGSTRSPLWRHGGVTFGPQPRDYAYSLPRKVRRVALKSALSDKVRNGSLIVLEELVMDQPKTKRMAEILEALKVNDKALVVTGGPDVNVYKSARNIPGVTSLTAGNINVYDLLAHNTLVITREAVSRVEGALA